MTCMSKRIIWAAVGSKKNQQHGTRRSVHSAKCHGRVGKFRTRAQTSGRACARNENHATRGLLLVCASHTGTSCCRPKSVALPIKISFEEGSGCGAHDNRRVSAGTRQGTARWLIPCISIQRYGDLSLVCNLYAMTEETMIATVWPGSGPSRWFIMPVSVYHAYVCDRCRGGQSRPT